MGWTVLRLGRVVQQPWLPRILRLHKNGTRFDSRADEQMEDGYLGPGRYVSPCADISMRTI